MTESLDELFLFGEEKMEKAIAQLQKNLEQFVPVELIQEF